MSNNDFREKELSKPTKTIKKKKKSVAKIFTCKKQVRCENEVFNIKDPLVKSFEDI